MSQDGKIDINYFPDSTNNQAFKFLEAYTLPDAVGIVEKYLIIKKMTCFSGHQTRAAKAMGICEGTLRYKLKKYKISRKIFKI